jgi:hypothetical protein
VGGSGSSWGLPRRVVALRFLEAVLPVEDIPVVSALFKAFSARAAERVLKFGPAGVVCIDPADDGGAENAEKDDRGCGSRESW